MASFFSNLRLGIQATFSVHPKPSQAGKFFLLNLIVSLLLYSEVQNSMKAKIIVFGTPTCSWCRKVKDYLSSHGFTYKYIDVSKNEQALRDMQRKTGQLGVPQLWINNTAVVGFDKDKINRLLQIQ